LSFNSERQRRLVDSSNAESNDLPRQPFLSSLCTSKFVYKSENPICHTCAVPGNLPLQILGAPPSAKAHAAILMQMRDVRSDSAPFVRVCLFIAPKSETRYVRPSGGRVGRKPFKEVRERAPHGHANSPGYPQHKVMDNVYRALY
jgi:hypothetical protein